MKVAYVAGKYRAPTVRGIVENIRAAEAVAIELWRMGFAVVCPHLNTACFDGAAPDEVWLKGDLEILSRCDLVVMVPGWEQSSGACGERDFAEEHDLPVYYWPEYREGLLADSKADWPTKRAKED
jgi:hypothetical protein